MYEPKDQYGKVIGALKILPNKTDAEINRVLSVYGMTPEELPISLENIDPS